MRYWIAILLLVVATFELAAAQPNPVMPTGQTIFCGERPTARSEPWMAQGLACLEEVINDPGAGQLGYTALAASPDGTLFAARPLAGEVVVLADTDGDALPDTPQVVATGLTLPNGLAYYEGALYISGGSHVYRLRERALETLVDDLPSGGGFWTGGIAVSDRIYVATGAPCDFCVADDPARGAVLSFALDGSDRKIVATGLRNPADLTFAGDTLYVVDSARSGLFDTPDLDEIDRVEAGANFGFPSCVGLNNTPDLAGFDCTQASAPVVALPTASTPIGLAAYRGDAIPSLVGKLLVVLYGSYNQLDLRGYSVALADPVTGALTSLMPARPDDTPGSDFTVQQMNYRGSGFFPQRPLDVAVTEAGWVYISIGGGRILALRP